MPQFYEKEFFVYQHLIDGIPFYVGSSKIKYIHSRCFRTIHCRAFDAIGRTACWRSFVDERYFEVKIISYYPTLKESLSAEKELIQKLNEEGCKLTNIVNGMPIYQFNIFGDFLNKWPSIAEAAQTLSLDPSSISRHVNTARGSKTSYGFYWSYEKIASPSIVWDSLFLVSIDENGQDVKAYWNSAHAALECKMKTISSITNAITNNNKASGFYWERRKWKDIQYSSIGKELKELIISNGIPKVGNRLKFQD
jgi:hypothetical protein